MSDKKVPEAIEDKDLEQAQGGGPYLKPGVINGDSTLSTDFDLSIKEAEIKDFDGVRATGVRIQHDGTKLRK